LEEFCGERLSAYGKRKAHELARLLTELVELRAKLLFVKAVVDKRLVIANVEDEPLLAALKGLGLPALSLSSSGEGDGLKGYEYLLRMRVDRLKASAVVDLERDVASTQAAHDALAARTPEALWLADLDEFDTAWTDYTEWRIATYKSAAAAVVKKKAYDYDSRGGIALPDPYNFRKRKRAAIIMFGYTAFKRGGNEYFEGQHTGGVSTTALCR
jgi:hypothetical protein